MALRLALAAALVVVLGTGLVTLLALEGNEVAVLRTADARGGAHDTRLWVADDAGATWIEAANAERPFLHAIEENPHVTVRRGGASRACRATVLANPDGHDRIRRLLSAKYGWADRWIGVLTDTSGSLAVRLDCS